MKKEFVSGGKTLPVAFGQGVARIENNEELWAYINADPPVRTRKLVEWIQKNYSVAFGGRLGISDNSFIMEIWGHLYFEYFLLRNETVGRILFPFGLYRRLVESCAAIDCGESGVDTNRWLWDFLGMLTPLAAKIIPKNGFS